MDSVAATRRPTAMGLSSRAPGGCLHVAFARWGRGIPDADRGRPRRHSLAARGDHSRRRRSTTNQDRVVRSPACASTSSTTSKSATSARSTTSIFRCEAHRRRRLATHVFSLPSSNFKPCLRRTVSRLLAALGLPQPADLARKRPHARLPPQADPSPPTRLARPCNPLHFFRQASAST